MGLPISLALRGRHADDDRGEAAWRSAVEVLRDADAVFSTYRDESIISRLSRGELDIDECPAEVHEVLALGEQARLASGGVFNVWRPGPGGRPALDPSGVVKGWAVGRAARELEVLDATDFCLSAGGDMVCRTADPSMPPWQIGIEDPLDPARVVAVMPMRDGAIATSGITHRGNHITDARTGAVPTAIASVTVIGADLATVDIDATIAFGMDREAIPWLEGRAGRCGLVVWRDGSTELFGYR